MGASFGSGASGSLFGATGSANFMSRSTAVCAAIFFACTLALAYFSNDRARPASGSVLDRPAVSAPAASVPLTGAAQIPTATNPPAASAAAAPAAPATPAPQASGAGAVPTK
jgi:preprotein translocase subunit SecG